MKLIVIFAASIFLMPSFSNAATNLDDCVLNGLKGVSSDVAARMIRQACESKSKVDQKQLLIAKYGEPSNEKFIFNGVVYKDGGAILKMKNESSKTALIVSMTISKTVAGLFCSLDGSPVYIYKTKLKPMTEADFWVPLPNLVNEKDSICAEGVGIRSRPIAWTDIEYGVIKPISSTELRSINQDLGTSYGGVYVRPAY